jgi:hypothetical protein
MQPCAVEFLLQTKSDDHCESQEELESGSSTKIVVLQGRCDKAHSHGTESNSVPSSAAFYAKSHPSMLQNFYRRKQCATPEFLKKATKMTFL